MKFLKIKPFGVSYELVLVAKLSRISRLPGMVNGFGLLPDGFVLLFSASSFRML
jgi:hypothetical protein